MPGVTELYDRDFYAWTQDQAAVLRAWPETMRPNALDIAHIAEEIEDLGASQRNAVKSLTLQILIHLLKVRFHPDDGSVQHWRGEVTGFRIQLEDIFRDSPSLLARRAALAEPAWRQAVRVLRELLDRGEQREALEALTRFTADAPYFDLDREVLDPDWFPERG